MKTKIKSLFVLFLLCLLLMPISNLLADQIKNQDKPQKGSWDFQMVKEWDVDEVNGKVFAQISSIVSDPSGKLFLVDRKHSKIFVLDDQGKFITSFGSQGEGPGEIKNMGSCYLVNKKLVFPDRGRMHYFAMDGKYLETKIFPNTAQPRGMIDENLILSVPYINWNDLKGQGKFSIYDIPAKKERLLFTFNTFRKGVVRKSSGKSTSTFSYSTSSLTPMMELDYQPATKRLVYGMTDNYLITVRDLQDVENGGTGKEILTFSVDREKQKVPKGFKDKQLETIKEWPDSVKQQIKDGFPDYLTHFVELHGDERGFTYVYRNLPNTENIVAMDIVSPKGVYLYEGVIAVDEDLNILSTHWNGDHLYMVTENEDGELILSKYKIKLPQ